jgi:hypothetical protein
VVEQTGQQILKIRGVGTEKAPSFRDRIVWIDFGAGFLFLRRIVGEGEGKGSVRKEKDDEGIFI